MYLQPLDVRTAQLENLYGTSDAVIVCGCERCAFERDPQGHLGSWGARGHVGGRGNGEGKSIAHSKLHIAD